MGQRSPVFWDALFRSGVGCRSGGVGCEQLRGAEARVVKPGGVEELGEVVGVSGDETEVVVDHA